MKIAVLGTGIVGTTIGRKLVELGHHVSLGSRSADNEKARAWVEELDSERARAATYADAAGGAELVFNCTAGAASLEALNMAGAAALADKILVDISNPLDFSEGMPPTMTICNDSSLGEQIQAAFPEARVVKTLNTVNSTLMINPRQLPGQHVVFVAGNDDDAKRFVEHTILRDWLAWPQVIDLGDISSARGTEMYLPLWLRLWNTLGTPNFNIAIVQN